MSSMHRDIKGSGRVHHLTAEEGAIDSSLLERTGRSGRTLVKEGALRVTLLVLAPGADLPAHHADGPVTIHVIKGEMELRAQGTSHFMREGDLVALEANAEHSVHSEPGAKFLVTVVHSDPAS